MLRLLIFGLLFIVTVISYSGCAEDPKPRELSPAPPRNADLIWEGVGDDGEGQVKKLEVEEFIPQLSVFVYQVDEIGRQTQEDAILDLLGNHRSKLGFVDCRVESAKEHLLVFDEDPEFSPEPIVRLLTENGFTAEFVEKIKPERQPEETTDAASKTEDENNDETTAEEQPSEPETDRESSTEKAENAETASESSTK